MKSLRMMETVAIRVCYVCWAALFDGYHFCRRCGAQGNNTRPLATTKELPAASQASRVLQCALDAPTLPLTAESSRLAN